MLSDLPLHSEDSYWINLKSVHWSVLSLDDWHCVVNSGENWWGCCLTFLCNGSINHFMINMLTGTFFIFCYSISSSKKTGSTAECWRKRFLWKAFYESPWKNIICHVSPGIMKHREIPFSSLRINSFFKYKWKYITDNEDRFSIEYL